MISMAQIRALSRKIVREFHPERVILFGSYARGTATEDSDVDLLVVLPFEGSVFRKSLEIMNRVDVRYACDLLVRTPENVQQRLEMGDFFIEEIIRCGKVLYERNTALACDIAAVGNANR